MSSRHDLQHQAALWIRRLNEVGTGQDVQTDFIRWCRQSPRHVRAVLELGQLSEELQRLDATAQELDNDSLGDRLLSNAQAAALDEGRAFTTHRSHRRALPAFSHTTRQRRRRLCRFAMLAMSIAGLLLFSHGAMRPAQQDINTQAGESRRVILPDNTYVRLGPNSRMTVRFNAHQRLISFSHGDALFHVTHDPSRPFLVSTDILTARALGTTFAVSRHSDGDTPTAAVIVASGKVEVQPVQRPSAAIYLSANQQAVLQPNAPAHVNRVDPRDELAWVDNRLVFYQGATLATAAQQFNRRNRLQILIPDASLAARPVMGTFRATDPQAFLDYFAPRMPFAIMTDSPDQVRLLPL